MSDLVKTHKSRTYAFKQSVTSTELKLRMNISIAVVVDVAENLLEQHDKKYLAIEKAAKQGTIGAFGIVLSLRLNLIA